MIREIRKAGFVWAVVLLIPTCFVWYNNTFNQHSHILSNGTIITHAHPLWGNQNNSSPYQDHRHSRGEYAFFALVFDLLTLNIFIGGIFFFFRRASNFIFPEYTINLLLSGATENDKCRAPPLIYYR